MSGTSVAVEERAAATDGSGSGIPTDGGRQPRPRGRSRARNRRSSWFLAGAVLSFGAALVVAVSLFASDRQPGQSATGSFAQSQYQQIEETLAQAATDENQGQLGPAAQLYQSVLDQASRQRGGPGPAGVARVPDRRAGQQQLADQRGRTKLNRAVGLDPGDYAARLYLGTLLFQQDGDAAGAVAQYRQFLADDPPETLVAQAAPELRAAYQKAGVALPSQVAAG